MITFALKTIICFLTRMDRDYIKKDEGRLKNRECTQKLKFIIGFMLRAIHYIWTEENPCYYIPLNRPPETLKTINPTKMI